MTKSLNQFVIGAIVGATAYEMVKKKNPQLVTDVKQNLQELGSSFESIYKEAKEIFIKTYDYKKEKTQTKTKSTKRKRIKTQLSEQ